MFRARTLIRWLKLRKMCGRASSDSDAGIIEIIGYRYLPIANSGISMTVLRRMGFWVKSFHVSSGI